MDYENDPIVAAALAEVAWTPFIGTAPRATSKLYRPKTQWDEADKHITIGGSGKVSMAMDSGSGMDWMNNGAIYQNMTTNCYMFLAITLGPVTQQGATTICGATLFAGESTPDVYVGGYWGTNIYNHTLFSRGMITAWILPQYFYGIQGVYGGRIDEVIRYYLPDPGGDEAPPIL
jgi:hypothetical protein